MNNGLPSATVLIRASAAASTRSPPTRPSTRLPRLVVAERQQRDQLRVGPRRRPVRSHVEQLAPGQADHQDRRPPGPVGEVLEHLQEGRFGKMDVVEDDDHRPRRGQLLEQLADRPEKLLDGGLRHLVTQDAGEACGDQLTLVPGVEQRAELADALRRGVGRGDTGGVVEHFHDRPEGDALAIGQAATGQDPGTLLEPGNQLLDQPCLADACIPDDRHELAAGAGRAVERSQQPTQLVLAVYQHRVQTTPQPGGSGDDPWTAQAVTSSRFPLSASTLGSSTTTASRTRWYVPHR